jgi:hypothetical protein
MTAVVLAVAVPSAGGSAVAFPDAPRSQHYPDQNGSCPAAAANRYLPSNAGCVTARRVDVDGDGRKDLVLLYSVAGNQGAEPFTLKVVRAHGPTLSRRIAGFLPLVSERIDALANVNDRPGVEIFVHSGHISTFESVALFAFDGTAVRRAITLQTGGGDSGIKFGYTCGTVHGRVGLVQRFFERASASGLWTRTDTSYLWQGARLVRTGPRRTTPLAGGPPRSQVGEHCG